jgi:acetoin utilization deacetylase AcuC-like enzyme
MPVSLIYSDRYTLDWPGHVFPVRKYRMVRDQLFKEGLAIENDFIEPQPVTDADVLLVHTQRHLDHLRWLARNPEMGVREMEVPVTDATIEAFYHGTGGTAEACREALGSRGCAVNLAGGFHHAFAEHGEGFCLINDIAIALRVMQRDGMIRTAAVIDCDLHQGNGTAHIFKDDPSVFTFSIHQENNYPVKQSSGLDVGLADFAGNDEYMAEMERHVPRILDEFRPDLVLYDAGADPFERDLLGTLKLTMAGMRRRDEFVFGECHERGLPVLGGGYARDTRDVVDIHCQMVKIAMDTWK